MTLVMNTYNHTCQKLYLLRQLFYRSIFYYIFCVICSTVASFILFSVSFVLPYHVLIYYICCSNCSAVTYFIIFDVSVVLSLHFLLYLLYQLLCHSIFYLLYQLFSCGIFYCVGCDTWSAVALFTVHVISVVLLHEMFLPLHSLLLQLAQLAIFHAQLSARWECSVCAQTSLQYGPAKLLGQPQRLDPQLNSPKHNRTGPGLLTQKRTHTSSRS